MLIALWALLAACTPVDAPPVRLLVVVSGLRSDHSSLCGYRRATTPTLERLRTAHRATFTCNARASSADPVAALAGVLLDASVPEHGLSRRRGPSDGVDRPTLADNQPGWRSVLVSGAAWVPPELTEGFDEVALSPGARASEVVAAAESRLAGLTEPTLIVVHLIDPVDPWPDTPPDAAWGAGRGPLDLDAPTAAGPSLRVSWREATLSANQRERMLTSMTDHYDHGVRAADAAVAELFDAIEATRGSLAGVRAVVTGDAGYYLGEHLQVGQVDRLWEPGVAVPILLVEPEGDRIPAIPSAPLSTRAVGHLLERGIVPRPTPFPVAHGVDTSTSPEVDGVALWWPDGSKLASYRGYPMVYKLGEDRGEQRPKLPFAHEAWPSLEELEASWAAWLSARETP
jgi:hypothetical protein